MKQDTTHLAKLLTEKKELIRLFVIAAILAFSVGTLGSIFAAQTLIPVWVTTAIAVLLIFVSFSLLARDLKSSLSFEDEIDGVIFIDPKRNETIPVRDYDFSEKLHETLSAVKAESRSIFSEWEKEPIVPAPSDKSSPEPRNATPNERPTYTGIFKVTVDREAEKPPQAARLLEEAVSFVLLEALSTHLSTYFNNYVGDEYIKEYRREDIPYFLLKNRVLNLLSTPIEQRDIFLNAFPNGAKRPEGELYALWGSDGSMYSIFHLVLPNGTTIQHSEVGRSGLAFLDTKSGRHKWMNCSIVTAMMPIERSRHHETVAQEPLIEVQSPGCAGSIARGGDARRACLTPRRARHPDRCLAQAGA